MTSNIAALQKLSLNASLAFDPRHRTPSVLRLNRVYRCGAGFPWGFWSRRTAGSAGSTGDEVSDGIANPLVEGSGPIQAFIYVRRRLACAAVGEQRREPRRAVFGGIRFALWGMRPRGYCANLIAQPHFVGTQLCGAQPQRSITIHRPPNPSRREPTDKNVANRAIYMVYTVSVLYVLLRAPRAASVSPDVSVAGGAEIAGRRKSSV